MLRKKALTLGMFFLAGFVLVNIFGCTIVFQKGRKSDIDRIQTLEQEIDRLAMIKAELEEKLKGMEGVSLDMEDRGLVITFLDEILFRLIYCSFCFTFLVTRSHMPLLKPAREYPYITLLLIALSYLIIPCWCNFFVWIFLEVIFFSV